MTKDQLIQKLSDIELDDFEVKAAKNELQPNYNKTFSCCKTCGKCRLWY